MAYEQILLAADAPLSERLSGILRGQEYPVHVATSSVRALSYIETHRPALILLAARAADVSGFELCRRLKERRRTRNIPLLFLTENPDEETEALRLGASDFISSPYREAEVLARVRTYLELASSRAARAMPDYSPSHSYSLAQAPEESSRFLSDGWMRLAMQAGRMYSFEWDVQSDAVRRSFASVDILGSPETEDTASNFFRRVHPNDVERIQHVLAILGPGYDMYDTQYRLWRPDGSLVNLRESGRGFFDNCGRLRRVIGMVADVTEQVTALHDLEQGRAHLLQLIQRLPIGVALANEQGRIEYINERFMETFGYRVDEIAERDAWWNKAYPDENYRREVIDTWDRAVEAAIRAGENIPPAEYRITGKDGREHSVNVSGAVLGSWKLLLFDDITERKRAEAALRESDARFRLMADTAPVLLWVAGPDKLCTFFNKNWLSFRGRTMEQELGEGWVEGVHRDDLERCLSTYNTAFDAREKFQMEYRLRCADGEYRWILDTGAPRFADDGTFAGYIGSCIEITEFKRNQEQMLAAQKLESLGVLAGGVAHDFHNFLGCILADAVVTMSELDIDSPARDGLERIEAVAVQAAQIVRQIMDYSGSEQPDLGPVDLSTLVREMVQVLRACVPKTARMNVNLPASLSLPRANATQLRQVVMNLILNAGEAMGSHGGTIAITGKQGIVAGPPEGHYVCLEVTDTGSGMSEEVLKHIFDPSFSTRGAGRGMGLAAVQGIVRGHGGSIEVTSTLGRGTRFRILFPCDGVQPVRGAGSGEPASEPAAPRRGSIMIVEDEETLRISVATMLRKQGFYVLEAGDGDRAVELIRSQDEDIAVVLLDLTLPGRSSPEVFAELQRTRPDAKVILTSAYGRESVAGPLKALERQSFIRKPYHFSELVTVVRQALPHPGMPVRKHR
jgi:two-component system cell cycle sensor histidine kinase/response regulator CckA